MPQEERDTPERKALIEIAVESWKFVRLFARLAAKQDAGEQGRLDSQLRWYVKRLEEQLATAGLKLVNIQGHPYDAGVAAAPLNAGDFAAEDILYVDQMLEPIIMDKDGLVRGGTVLLRKFEK